MKPLCRAIVTLMLGAGVALTGCRSTRTVVTSSSAKVTEVGGKKGDIVDRRAPSTEMLMGEQRLLVDEALTWLGTPYRYGGNDREGVDCSGLTTQVYLKALGMKLPRTSRDQQRYCVAVERASLTPGDLVFFAIGSDTTRVSHVGMYVGEGKMIHSSGSKGVIISDLNESYYRRKYHSSGHVARPSDRAFTKSAEPIAALPAPPPAAIPASKPTASPDTVYTSLFD